MVCDRKSGFLSLWKYYYVVQVLIFSVNGERKCPSIVNNQSTVEWVHQINICYFQNLFAFQGTPK